MSRLQSSMPEDQQVSERATKPEKKAVVKMAVARALALFLSGFTLLNLAGNLLLSDFDANLWWIDLRALPPQVGYSFLGSAAISLLAFGVRPHLSVWRCWLTIGMLSLLLAVTLENALQFYLLLLQGAVTAKVPVPLSLMISAALFFILRRVVKPAFGAEHSRRQSFFWIGFTLLLCLVCFPLAQVFCFGKTDYRRSADAIVVFGARVYADGRPSDALADRVRTACQLYRQGFARKIIFSGGPGDGTIHETEAMRRMAVGLGVSAEDILLDQAGLNTRASAKNTCELFRRKRFKRVLAVSHFYHLPRIKMTYQREGFDVYTVPAQEAYLLRQTPYSIGREILALWVYYLRPLWG
jgi:uncharacterized SAM-binding protein YcdF (DUF218 family)